MLFLCGVLLSDIDLIGGSVTTQLIAERPFTPFSNRSRTWWKSSPQFR